MKVSNPAPKIILQDRDIALLRGLFEARVMTSVQIAEVFFQGQREMAKKRLQVLKRVGFISERPREVTEAAALSLTKDGLGLLGSRQILAEYPSISLPGLERRARVSEATIRHELEVGGVKAAFYRAVRVLPKLSIAEFTVWPLLNEFTASRSDGSEVLVKPDGFLRLHEQEAGDSVSEHVLFLEVDRSTEMQSILVNRAACYLEYYKSGGFAERNGAARSAFKDFPFRVLYVLKNDERRNNTAEGLLRLNPPILMHVWLTTMAEIEHDPFGPIWMRPADYRDAIMGTGFDLELSQPRFGYRRQTARELHVKERAKKSSLLD